MSGIGSAEPHCDAAVVMRPSKEEDQMVRTKAVSQRGIRRKLRVARGRWGGAKGRGNTRSAAPAEMTTSGALGKAADAALAIATACNAASVGFDLCARRTQDETIAVAATNAAAFLRSLSEVTVAAAASKGIDAQPRARTCDRLRWEWLASTASVVDGEPDGRLLSECARILAGVDATGAAELDNGIAARFQIACVEAYSLASTVLHRRQATLALAAS